MLEVKELHKAYGDFVAVHPLSFSLKPGDVFGFIGSNGAGKTTTIKMLATLLEPTSGTATLNNVDISESPMQIRRMIGYMPDFFGLYDDIKVWEYLDFFASIYGISNRQEVVNDVLQMISLENKREAFVQTLSRGMQQRLCLGRCLVHNPSLLLLDEPASGLDPRARAEFKELISDLSLMGKMIVISSHILPELADLCNKVGIIERGTLLASGNVNEILESIAQTKKIIAACISDIDNLTAILAKDKRVKDIDLIQGGASFNFSGTLVDQADLLDTLVGKGVKLTSFYEERADLEDVFMKITTGDVN